MSNITPHLSTVSIPPGTAEKTFEVDLPGLEGSSGWVWYRPRPTWIEAQQLPSFEQLKEFTVHMLLLRTTVEEYICVLPISTDTALANLSRRDGKGLVINVRGASRDKRGHAAVVVTRTSNERYITALPRVAICEGRKWLLQLTGEHVAYLPVRASPFDGVGFCTWNALQEGRNVNEGSIRHLVDTLVRARLPIQTFIVDDGWHDKRHFRDHPHDHDRRRGLWSFDAKPEIGKAGMKGIVTTVKEMLEGVKGVGKTDVGAWIALTGGYWDGVHPDSPLVKKYGCVKYRASRQWWRGCPPDPLEPNHMPSGASFYILPPPNRAAEFWHDWFTQLHDAGITFLKIDNQAAVTSLDGVDGVAEALMIWKTMYRIAEKIFGTGMVIHCMSHSEAMWAGPQGLGLTTKGERFVWRNSDDFGLEGRSPYAHQQHVFTNIMNTLVSNTLCTIPDADMFMTSRQHPHAHALLRALFPGPLLLTDKPGEHSRSLLLRLLAPDRQGRATVLKAPRAAEPLARRVMDTSVLDYSVGSGLWAAVAIGPVTVVGVWNVRGGRDRPQRLQDEVTIHDVEDALGHALDENYFVTRVGVQTTGVLSTSLIKPGDSGSLCKFNDLPMMGAATFWIAQAVRLPVGRLAVLGLVDQYAGSAALESVELSTHAIEAKVRCAGKFGVVVAAPHQPCATALVDRRPETVTVTLLPSLAGEKQGVFLLTLPVGHASADGYLDLAKVRHVPPSEYQPTTNGHPAPPNGHDVKGDVWSVHISIE